MNSMLRAMRTCIALTRHASTLPAEAVIFAEDDIVVCWHPERAFPYECSLPLPEEKLTTDSVLCIGDEDIADVFRKKQPRMVVEDLAKITYTCKHRWYPRSRDKRAKTTEADRPYL